MAFESSSKDLFELPHHAALPRRRAIRLFALIIAIYGIHPLLRLRARSVFSRMYMPDLVTKSTSANTSNAIQRLQILH